VVLAEAIARKAKEGAWAAVEESRGAAAAVSELGGLIGQPPPDLWVPSIMDASCAAAWQYEMSEAQLATGLAGRRGGKTHSNMRLATRYMALPGKAVLYVSLQEKSAQEQFFYPLIEMLVSRGWRSWDDRDKHKGAWDFKANRTLLVLRTRWGSVLRCFSAHDMRTAGAVRGYPSDLMILDEGQEPRDDVVRHLMDRIAMAFVIDRGGRIRITGTVPAIEPCYFSEAIDSPGWEHHLWSAYHHDHPKPREEKIADLVSLCEKKAWRLDLVEAGQDVAGRPIWTCGPDTAIEIASEFFAKRVKDPNTVLYEYDPERNGQKVPEDYCDMFAIGLDLAWHPDLASINVRGWRSDDPLMRSWQLYEWADNQLPAVAPEGRPSIGAELARVLERWPAWIIVADDATGGDKIAIATLSEMLGIVLTPKPRNVGISVETWNEDFRTGRAHIDKASATAAEVQHMRKIPKPNAIGWKFEIVASRARTQTADGKEGKISHKDHASAGRYAAWGCRAYWNQARPDTAPLPTKSVFEMNHDEMQAERRRVAMEYLRSPMGTR
jgi:hypothetical protein